MGPEPKSMEAFTQFWSSGVPRFGDRDAKGMADRPFVFSLSYIVFLFASIPIIYSPIIKPPG